MKRLMLLLVAALVILTIAALEVPSAHADSTTVNGLDRKGPGRFTTGEAVVGWEIRFNNGATFRNCYFPDVPMGGTVTDGVINPWKTEVAKVSLCTTPINSLSPTVNGLARRPAPGIVRFNQGEAVYGLMIVFDNGRGLANCDCYVLNSPTSGWVYLGVINPLLTEIKGKTLRTP